MNKVMVPLFVFLAIIGGVVAASAWKKSQQAANAPYPPRGAQLMAGAVAPEDLFALRSAKKRGATTDDLTPYRGLWLNPPGWEGTVEIVADESSGQTLRWQVPFSGLVGASSFWVIAVLEHSDSAVKVGSVVNVVGQFEDADSWVAAGSPVPQYRCILRHARITSIK